jgi:hypothetical protein
LKPNRAVMPIALIVLAASAAAYAFLVDRAAISDGEREARKRDVLPSFRVDEVRRMELTHGAEVLVLERGPDAGATWMMTSPRHERADPAVVDVLTRELEMATRVRDVPPAEASGLDAPRVRGRITVGAIEYTFVLGGDAPRPAGAAYMRVDGEGTFVAGRSLCVQLLRGADAYRDRTLVRYGVGEVARIDLRDSTRSLTLERKGGTFRIGDAGGLRASRTSVDRLFGALAEMRAESFLDDALADVATAKPALTLVVQPRDVSRPKITVLIGDRCPGDAERFAVVRTEPERMSGCVAKNPGLLQGELEDDHTDRRPFFVRADEMEELRLESLSGDGPRVDIARRGAGWRERAPEDRDLIGEEVDSANALAGALSNAAAVEVRPGAGQPFVARWRVTAVRTGTETTEVVDLASPGSDGTTLAERADDTAILRLSRPVARHFEPRPIALRSPVLWRPSFDAASVIAIDDSCGLVPQHLAMREGLWKTRGGKVAGAAAANELADTFAHARAALWISENDDGTFGLSSAGSCSVTLTLATDDGGTRRAGLVLGAAEEGGVYARTLDSEAVLLAPSALSEIAGRPQL